MAAPAGGPRRRCVGCGRVAPKSELVRVALARHHASGASRAVLDREGRLQGRGAYLCAEGAVREPRMECLVEAVRRRGVQRTLRSNASLDPKLVESVGR